MAHATEHARFTGHVPDHPNECYGLRKPSLTLSGILRWVFVCAVLVTLHAPAWAQVGLEGGTATAGPGDEVLLPVDLSSDGSVVALQFDLVFDAGALDVSDANAGAALVDHVLDTQPVAPGRLRVVVTANSLTPMASGRLVDLRVSIGAQATPGDYALILEAVRLADVQAQPLQPNTLVDGLIQIEAPAPPPSAPPGVPGPTNGAGTDTVPVPGLTLAGLGILFTLVLAMAWLFLRHGAQGVVLSVVTASVLLSSVVRAQVLPGDANSDGAVNAQDIPVIVNEIQERQAAPGDADCTMDGLVDVLDAVCVLQPGDDPDPENQPPQLDALSDRMARVGDAVSLVATASDPDLPGDRLAWSLSRGPVGTSLAKADGSLLWAPSEDQLGDNLFTVRVTDEAGAFDEASFTVNVGRRGSAPRLADIENQVLVLGESLALNAVATDPDLPGDILNWTISPAPAGMVIDAASGMLSWTPGASQLGTHDVTVSVTDVEGRRDFRGFSVTVTEGNRAPVGVTDQYTVEIGGLLQVTPVGVLGNDSDPDGDPLVTVQLEGPQNGDLLLGEDGGFEYRSRRPEPLNASPPYLENVNLSLEAVPTLEPFNVGIGRHLERIVDGDPTTSGSAPGGFYFLPLEVRFDAEDVTVREVRILGDRQADTVIAENTEARLRLLDRNGDELYDSGPIALSLPNRDAALTLEPPVVGVHVVEYRATAWSGPGAQGFILGELEILGDGTRQRLPMVEEWHWDGEGTDRPDQENVQATPVVIDLDDDEVPEVVFAAGPRAVSRPMGWVQILDGASGEEKFSPTFCSEVATHMAGGDIDGDGFNEVIAVAGEPVNGTCQAPNPYRLRAIAHDGTEKWLSEPIERPAGWGAAIVLADLDGDGKSEILHGRQALDHEGRLLWTAEGVLANSYLPEVADLDLDGEVEVVYGASVYDRFGVQEWTTTSNKDWSAIGNFDDDPFAEIFVNGPNRSQLLDHDGQLVWTSAYLSGGPPTVGDFDADGEPEIGFARGSDYVVLETDGSLKWSRRIKDGSSGRTGSSLFDFDGDGRVEVVQSDEAYFRIWDGATGNVRFRVPLTSITNTELPLVADVDGDGQAEVLVPANGWPLPGTEGVYVFGGAEDDFVRARPIWNQHGYHVTNVMADGRIPADEPQNWLVSGLNHHRVNDFLPDERARADRFVYAAYDGELASEPVEVFIDIVPERFPPVITSLPVKLASPGFEYFYDVQAEDRNKDPLNFSLAAAPAGMTIDAGTGLLRWMPSDEDLGRHLVDIRVNDPDGAEAIQAFFLDVLPAVEVPDVVGETEDGAGVLLEAANLSPGRTSTAFDPLIPTDHVAGQQPLAGSVAPAGSRVDLVLSLGAGPEDTDDDGDGYSENEGDCDDGDDSRYPGADDVPGDDIDQDCDGYDATEPLVELRVIVDRATLLVGESIDLSAWGMHEDGTATRLDAIADWVSDGPAASVGDNGLVQGAQAGTVTITATHGGRAGTSDIAVVAVDPGDATPPQLDITSPDDGDTVFAPMDVRGTVIDDGLVRWTLAIAPAGTNAFTTIATGTAGVMDGVLGQLDPTLMLNGLHTLRLTAQDAGNNARFVEVGVLLEGGMKVGHFTLTYQDLSVPVSGFPITVNRIYDSRDKRKGAFGVGWRLGIETLEISCSEDLGEGWYVAKAGIQYGLLPTRSHACSVQLPGQRAEVFDLVVEPAVSVIVPYTFLTARFVARPGTTGSLEVPGGIFLAIIDPQPGEVRLLDDGDLGDFDPQAFRYTTVQGLTATFEGRSLRTMEDPNGNRLTLTGNGLTHSSGLGVSFTRDDQGRIVQLSDPMGRLQTYQYDANGDLAQHVDRAGFVSDFRYGLNHLLVDYDTPGRRPARNDYDENGRLVAITDAAGHRIEVTHDLSDRSGSRTDRNGHSVFYRYDEEGNLTALVDERGEEWAFTHDDQGRRTSTTNPLGETTSYVYDPLGNVTAITDPAGAEWRFDFDAQGRLVRALDPTGVEMTHRYDARGNLLESTDALGNARRFSYDASGNQVGMIDEVGRETRFAYNEFGQLTEATLPGGAVQAFDLDAVGDRVGAHYSVQVPQGEAMAHMTIEREARGLPSSLKFPVGADPMTLSYDSAGGIAETVDGEGNRQTLARDLLGRVTGRIDPAGTAFSVIYDAEGRDVDIVLPSGGAVQTLRDERGDALETRLPDSDPWTRTYDAAGRLSSSSQPGVGETRVEYDAAGHTRRLELPDGAEFILEHDASGRVTAVTDPLGNTIRHQYDERGLTVATIRPDGAVLSYSYTEDGKLETRTDDLGVSWRYHYGDRGDVVAVEDPLGGVTRYQRDMNGQLSLLVSPEGRSYRFGYDAGGRRTRFTRPGGAVAGCDWDSIARPTTCTDFTGAVTNWQYDDTDLQITVERPEGTEFQQFDITGNLLSLTTPRGTHQYGYDQAFRPVSWMRPDGGSVTVGYAGSPYPVSLETSNGLTRAFFYDTRGALARTADPTGDYLFTTDAAGRPTNVSFPGGAEIVQAIDGVGRVTDVQYVTAGGATLSEMSYRYDAHGRLEQEVIDDSVRNYSYDDLGRLERVEIDDPLGTSLRTFAYDGDGNLLDHVIEGVSQSFSYDVDGHLERQGDVRLEWNANGQLVVRTQGPMQERFDYDSEGQLVRYARSGVAPTVVEYTYDPDGLLSMRRQNGLAEVLTWDRSGYLQKLIEITDESGNVLQRFLYRDAKAIAEMDADGTVVHHVRDRLGSLRLRIADNGDVLERFDYSAFGQRTDGSASPVGYTGGYTDPETGFVYLRTRWYAPDHARFISRDAAPFLPADPRGTNRYSYAFNDPLNRVDLSGQWPTLTQTLTTLATINVVAMAAVAYLTDPERAVSGAFGIVPVVTFWLKRVDGHFASASLLDDVPLPKLVFFPSVSVSAGIASFGAGLEFVRWNSGFRSSYAKFGSAFGYSSKAWNKVKGMKKPGLSDLINPGGPSSSSAGAGALSVGSAIADTPTPEDYQGAFVSAGVTFGAAIRAPINLGVGGQIFWSPVVTYDDRSGNARHSHGWRAGGGVSGSSAEGSPGLSVKLSFDWYYMLNNYYSTR